MTQFIPVHSFRRGTGKSNVIANVSVLLAAEGRRVGIIDIDLFSPSIHIPFGLAEAQLTVTLNDYLLNRREIIQAAYNVTPRLAGGLAGQIFIIPASPQTSHITAMLRQPYDPGQLSQGMLTLAGELALDVLFIDTHSGLNEETLIAMSLADTLIVLLRPDRQDYQGTGLAIELARRLNVLHTLLVINEVPLAYDFAAVKAEVEQAYGCEVAAVLPHRDEWMALASADIFVLRYPDHPITATLRQVAARLPG